MKCVNTVGIYLFMFILLCANLLGASASAPSSEACNDTDWSNFMMTRIDVKRMAGEDTRKGMEDAGGQEIRFREKFQWPSIEPKSPVCSVVEVIMGCVILCAVGVSCCHSAHATETVPDVVSSSSSVETTGDVCEGCDPATIDAHHKKTIKLQPLVYRPEIDGLRAIAVVPVICFHFDLGFPGGFTGVDVFYVISGFLVTRILQSDLQKPIWKFWMRRVRRLFPAMVLLLMAILPAGWLILQAEAFQSLCEQIRAVLFCIANVYYYDQTNYFFNNLEFTMLHCWSLAVEEQFYICYPFLLQWLWKRHSSPKATCILLALICLISFTASVVLVRNGASTFAFYMLPGRAWQFALGGMVVFAQDFGVVVGRAIAELFSWCGLAMILIPYFAFSSTMPYPGWGALLPCSGAALFMASNQTDLTCCGRSLALQWLTSVGKMSYALYLWHWPIYVLLVSSTDFFQLNVTLKVLGVALTMIAASFSSVWVEPYFRYESKVSSRAFFKIALYSWLTLMIVATAASATSKVHFEFGSSPICDMNHHLIDFLTPSPEGGQCLTLLSDAQLSDAFFVNASKVHVENIRTSTGWTQELRTEADGVLIIRPSQNDTQNISVAFIGDSHCNMYSESLKRLAHEYKKPILHMCKVATSGAFYGNLLDWDKTRLSYLDKWRPEMIVWIEWWRADWLKFIDFDVTLNLLLNRTQKIILLGDVPTNPIPPMKATSNGLTKAWVLKEGKKEGSFSFLNNLSESYMKSDRLALEEKLRRVASNESWHGRVKYVPVAPYFIHHATQKLMLLDPCKGTLVYKDFGHLTDDGARRVEPLFRKEFFGQATCKS